ncbi:methyltransferase domain-containing protein [Flavobacterium supellecticarium]|uniref:Methyltransferase domain-containing protein n=1 Tax=Flavobacterium supellecticarium TaxID=2565924 RepID=A0A4V3W7V4_9FLAO|nr:methyltransferase [Flavobacterium supellecticarium]THF48815.1 methyltransferase domain-containing protein [Flavobacterium supellecticarium]
MRKLIQRIISPFLQKASSIYLSKPRNYRYKNIRVRVEPGVFPPFITISTKLLLEFIEPLPLQNKTFLELGCGCGIISILAAQKGAQVTASDINKTALEALQKNAIPNQVTLSVIYSDLFQELSDRQFDYIVINPPYYPKTPQNTAESAWFCGKNFEYFEKLFAQLPKYRTETNKIYMILSEDCDCDTIQSIATRNALRMQVVRTAKVFQEQNYIFEIGSQ